VRLLLFLLLSCASGCAPPARAAERDDAKGACLNAPPPADISKPERDLGEVESLAKAIKHTTKDGICHALYAFDFDRVRTFMTPNARMQRLHPPTETVLVDGPRARGVSLQPRQPACFGDGNDFVAELQRMTRGWMRVERCAFDPVTIFATQGDHRRARVELHLWLGGAEPTGARVIDKGDVVAELAEDAGGVWRLTRLQWGERERFRATGAAFSDWTERARLPIDWPDAGYRRDLALGQILNGGISVGDYDGDGWPDLYVSRSGQSLLLRNDGKGGFTDTTARAGLTSAGNGQSALLVDLDNDGDLDLFLVNAWYSLVEGPHSKSPHRIYRNNGNGTFTLAGTLGPVGPASGASAADFNGDGKLDLYVTYYQDEALFPYHHRIEARDGFGNHLFLNRGGLRFQDVSESSGTRGSGWSYASAWADFDEDGAIDLYVANDFGDNALYRNRGNGTFEEVAARVRALDPANGMSVDWSDYDNDGHLDLYISNMYSKTGNQFLALYEDIDETLKRKLSFSVGGNTMYRGRGNGTFEEVSRQVGTNVAGWAWGANFFDYDNDGWLDLFVANGFWAGDSTDDA
jgi:hypothetical protein